MSSALTIWIEKCFGAKILSLKEYFKLKITNAKTCSYFFHVYIQQCYLKIYLEMSSNTSKDTESPYMLQEVIRYTELCLVTEDWNIAKRLDVIWPAKECSYQSC